MRIILLYILHVVIPHTAENIDGHFIRHCGKKSSCLGAHAQARYTECVCVCVCLSVCVDCYSCSVINEVQVYELL